jgi:hypothetical protein
MSSTTEAEDDMSKKLVYIAIAISALAFILVELEQGSVTSWILFSLFVFGGLIVGYLLSHPKELEILQPTESKTRTEIHNLVRNFNLFSLISREQYLFKNGYIIFVVLYSINALQILFFTLFMKPHRDINFDLSFIVNLLLAVVGIGLIFWTFYVWRQLISKTLSNLYDNHRILLPSGDIDVCYFQFLKEFRDAFRKRTRYIPIIIILILYGFYYIHYTLFTTIHDVLLHHLNDIALIFSFCMHLVIIAFILFPSMYCIGVILWTVFVSGRYFMKLIQTFEFKIEPLHPDKCGGLKMLGNLSFGIASPIFIGAAFYIGYIFVAVRGPKGEYDLVTVDLIIIIVAYGLIVAVPAFFLPLWKIHTKMLNQREADDESYARNLENLRLAIQVSLNEGKTEEANNLKKQLDLIQELHTTYPQWPFNAGSRFLSSFLALSGSLLLGFLTALEQPLVVEILRQHGFK